MPADSSPRLPYLAAPLHTSTTVRDAHMEAVSRVTAGLTDIDRRVFRPLMYAQALLDHIFSHAPLADSFVKYRPADQNSILSDRMVVFNRRFQRRLIGPRAGMLGSRSLMPELNCSRHVRTSLGALTPRVSRRYPRHLKTFLFVSYT